MSLSVLVGMSVTTSLIAIPASAAPSNLNIGEGQDLSTSVVELQLNEVRDVVAPVVAPVTVSDVVVSGKAKIKIERAALTAEAKPKPEVKEVETPVVEEKVTNQTQQRQAAPSNSGQSNNSRQAATTRSVSAPSSNVSNQSQDELAPVTRENVNSYNSGSNSGGRHAASTPSVSDNASSSSGEVKSTASKPKAPKSASAIVKHAYSGVGTPYVWGGTSPTSGWDCSGFVQHVYKKAGISIPRNTSAILASNKFKRTSSPKPGDLVFQRGGSHVGIYVGGGKMIGAQNPSVGTILHDVTRNPVYGYYTLKG